MSGEKYLICRRTAGEGWSGGRSGGLPAESLDLKTREYQCVHVGRITVNFRRISVNIRRISVHVSRTSVNFRRISVKNEE